MADKTTLERMTDAAMAEVKRQLCGQQIPGTPNESYWSATGDMNSLDFALIVRAAVDAMRDPKGPMPMGWDDVDTYEMRAYMNGVADAILAEGRDDQADAG